MRRRFAALVPLTVALTATAVTVTSLAPLDPLDPLGPGPVAEAAPDDVVAVVVEGTGNGHGRGLSQWGAYGYAVDHGWTWGRILDHYYGGTSAGTVAAGERIDVRLLGRDGARTVGVVSHGSPVTWKGITRTSMYAEETSTPGRFEVYGTNSVACPGAGSLVVPDGPEVYAPGTYAADVELVQAFLRAHHPPAASIVVDGYFGPQTEGFLRGWQTAQGLPVDGRRWDADDAARARQLIAAAGGSVSWTLLGTHTQSAGNPVRFTSTSGESSSSAPGRTLGLCNGSGGVTHYRGAIEVLSTGDGNRVVNDVKVEDYLRGVVPKEIAASWADAGGGAGVHAVRAQAVAARSYGLAQNRNYTWPGSGTRYATTCDSSSCQVYGGAARRTTASGTVVPVEDARTDAAIAATANVVRRWPNGSIVSTEFSASNGPRTAGGAFPPVNDVGDDTPKNPYHRWTRILDADDLAARYGLGELTGARMVESSNATYRQFDGIWFDDIVLSGTSGTFRDDAWDFRNAHGLRSPGFTVRVVTRGDVGASMAFIGDSVGNSITHAGGELRTLTDGAVPKPIFDAVDSRCTTRASCPGTSGVEAAAALPVGLDLVVVELGYNDDAAGFAADIDAMMAALDRRGVGSVLWVNMADIRRTGSSSRYAPSNAALQAATGRWANLDVLDWNAASDTPERPRWFHSDGVHLTATGQAEFALWLRGQLTSSRPSHLLAPPKRIELPIRGETLTRPDGSTIRVPNDARAVAINLTAVRPSRDGFATVYPCTASLPLVSNLNFRTGINRANSAIVPLSAAGTICVYSSAGTNAIVDVAGWFDGGSFVPVVPRRHVDTRSGGGSALVRAGVPLVVPMRGAAVTLLDGTSTRIPADAAAVAANVTIVRPAGRSFATVWPCGSPMPTASNVNFEAGVTTANGVIAPIGADGSICVMSDRDAHVVVDVAGWLDEVDAAGDGFRATIPTRLADTRSGPGPVGRVGPSAPLRIQVAGARLDTADGPVTVPSGVAAAALNVTAVGGVRDGYVTVWPCGSRMPTASNVNFRAGENVANAVTAPLGAGGAVCIHVSAPTHVVVDVAGWYAGGAAPSFVGTVPERLVDTRYRIGPRPS